MVQVEELELAEEQRQVVAIIFVAHTMAKESILPQRAFQASWLLGGLKVWLALGTCAVAFVWALGSRTAKPSSSA